jgi:AcrR family transcriptional regulator
MSAVADGRATRWAGQRERRRRELVDAAIAAIERHGPDVSVDTIAATAGVARPRVYRYFADKADLQGAVAAGIVDHAIAEFAPVWQPEGSLRQMVGHGVRVVLTWIAEHAELYRYVTGVSARADNGGDSYGDLKAMIATHLSTLAAGYLRAYGVDVRAAEPFAFGVVGMVESAAARRLERPSPQQSMDDLAALLSDWVCVLAEHMLRSGGVELDPDGALLPPAEVTR